MTSACGEEGAEFGLHLMAAGHHKMLHSGCQLSRGHFANGKTTVLKKRHVV